MTSTAKQLIDSAHGAHAWAGLVQLEQLIYAILLPDHRDQTPGDLTTWGGCFIPTEESEDAFFKAVSEEFNLVSWDGGPRSQMAHYWLTIQRQAVMLPQGQIPGRLGELLKEHIRFEEDEEVARDQ